jgi:uncharacterized protein YndB with AHSA1/START domain
MDLAGGDEIDRIVNARRVFPLSRERLFQAWTDPVELAKWWGPKAWVVRRCEIDLRPRGTWRTWFKLPDGSEQIVGGSYLEIDPPERLVFTWEPSQSGDALEVAPSIVTLRFNAHADGTELVLSHRKLTTGGAVDMDVGWTNTFDSLADYVEVLEPPAVSEHEILEKGKSG